MCCERAIASLVVLVALGAAGANAGTVPPHGGGACDTAWDCALGGICTAGKCVCDAWFTGSNCTLLNLQPAKPANGFDLSGLSTGGDSFHGSWTGWSSWGGHAVYDNHTRSWVGIFSLMARGCGLHDYHSNSESVVATSQQVDGPFQLADPNHPDGLANIAVPPPSHCTQIKRHPSGDYHLWHIFPGHTDNATSPDAQPPELTCTNGSTQPDLALGAVPPPPPPPHPCPASGCISPAGQQLFVHTAPSPHGPWSKHGTPIKLDTLNATTITQASCAAPFYHPNGSALLVVGGGACPQGWGGSGGAHGGGGGCLWEFESSKWSGPYSQVPRQDAGANPGDPITHPENEDPAIFVDPRGNYHMLTNVNTGHRRCGSGIACGGHLWSTDGRNWSNTFIGAFGPHGRMQNGSNFSLGYVERPQVAQMAPGEPPLALFISAGPKYMAGATFTWAQRFCDQAALTKGVCGFMGGVVWNGPLPKPPDPHPPPVPPTPRPAPTPPTPPPSKPEVGDVIAVPCGISKAQTWTANIAAPSTRVIWRGGSAGSPERCLRFGNRAAVHGHGQALIVSPCQTSSNGTYWLLTNGSTLKNSEAVPCIDWKGECQCAKTTAGTVATAARGLELWACDDQSLQPWVYSGGQLRVNGSHCASVVGLK